MQFSESGVGVFEDLPGFFDGRFGDVAHDGGRPIKFGVLKVLVWDEFEG